MIKQDVFEGEDLAEKRNKKWWRLEKTQIGRSRFP